jgi:pentatricopeptide repeat protein
MALCLPYIARPFVSWFTKAANLFSSCLQPVEWEYAKMVWVYALQREKHKARALFEQMCDRGIRPSRLAYHK